MDLCLLYVSVAALLTLAAWGYWRRRRSGAQRPPQHPPGTLILDETGLRWTDPDRPNTGWIKPREPPWDPVEKAKVLAEVKKVRLQNGWDHE